MCRPKDIPSSASLDYREFNFAIAQIKFSKAVEPGLMHALLPESWPLFSLGRRLSLQALILAINLKSRTPGLLLNRFRLPRNRLLSDCKQIAAAEGSLLRNFNIAFTIT